MNIKQTSLNVPIYSTIYVHNVLGTIYLRNACNLKYLQIFLFLKMHSKNGKYLNH